MQSYLARDAASDECVTNSLLAFEAPVKSERGVEPPKSWRLSALAQYQSTSLSKIITELRQAQLVFAGT